MIASWPWGNVEEHPDDRMFEPVAPSVPDVDDVEVLFDGATQTQCRYPDEIEVVS